MLVTVIAISVPRAQAALLPPRGEVGVRSSEPLGCGHEWGASLVQGKRERADQAQGEELCLFSPVLSVVSFPPAEGPVRPLGWAPK